MARGQKKPIEERITAKQEMIDALLSRVESEKKELEALLEEKRLRKYKEVSDLLDEAGMTTEDLTRLLKEYKENAQTA